MTAWLYNHSIRSIPADVAGALRVLSELIAGGRCNEFKNKTNGKGREKFVPFPIRCSIVGAEHTFQDSSLREEE
jgi:hypothetical protein